MVHDAQKMLVEIFLFCVQQSRYVEVHNYLLMSTRHRSEIFFIFKIMGWL